jgi:SAM-dependent methyltransferase
MNPAYGKFNAAWSRLKGHPTGPTLLHSLRRTLNKILYRIDFELVRRSEIDAENSAGQAIRSFLPLHETLAGARAAGLSVADYVDSKHQRVGATQETINRMTELGIFSRRIERICEIGAGSGRYLEKTIQVCHPSYYEIYETARDWSGWLKKTYNVTAHDADGVSLKETPSHSIDLVVAHKVFVYLPFLVACRYFGEMCRVVRPGGRVLFDAVTEDCMDKETLERWLSSGASYPTILPKQYIIDLFEERGCKLEHTFPAYLKPGRALYLVFSGRSFARTDFSFRA